MRLWLWVLLLPVLASACGGRDGATPSVPSPSPGVDATSFRVAVLLGGSQAPTAGDAGRVLARANDILVEKTGARMTHADVNVIGPGTPLAQAMSYVNAHATAPPDGVLVFSDDSMAASFDGYSQTFALPAARENRYPSPVVGASRVYLAVVHFLHMYARCGYDSGGNRIGPTSSGGECRNRSGMTCVNNGRYWACPDTLNDLYADPDYFTAAASSTSSCIHSDQRAPSITTARRSAGRGPACLMPMLRI